MFSLSLSALRWLIGLAAACVIAAVSTVALATLAGLPNERPFELRHLVVCQWIALVALRSLARGPLQQLIGLLAGVLAGAAGGLAIDVALDGILDVGRRFILLDTLFALTGVLTIDAALALTRRRHTALAGREEMVDIEQAFYGGAGSLRLFPLYRYRGLLRNLVAKDLRLKYRGSTLGFLWSLLNPLMSVAVYAFAFRYVLQIHTPNYALFLLFGVLPWTFFASSLLGATSAISDNVGLLRNALFPRAVLPMSVVLFNLSQFVLSLAVLLPVAFLAFGVPPTWSMLLFPVIVGLQCVFTLGVSFAIATLAAFYHDVRHLMEVGIGILFWLTPILYDVAVLPPGVREWILLNPITSFIVPYQQLFYHRDAPDPYILVSAAAFATASVAFGYSMFLATERRLMEQL